MKVVIATHPAYKHALRNCLKYIDVQEHIDDVIVCVSDVPQTKSQSVISEYIEEFGIKYVFTHHKNMDEYTSFIILAEAILAGNFADDNIFLMLHDTSEVGSRFWKEITCDTHSIEIKLDVIVKDNILTFANKSFSSVGFDNSQLMRRRKIFKRHVTTNEFIFEDGKLITPFSPKMYLSNMLTLTSDISNALSFENKDTVEITRVISEQLSDDTLWYPYSDSFNLGFITKHFLLNTVYPIYSTFNNYDKATGIRIENDPNHKYSLKSLSNGRWRYVRGKSITIFSRFQNDIDVYGNDKKRNVAYMHEIDLKKFLYFVVGSAKHIKA